MTYAVKELFYSLQGEGVQSGRAAVFLRLAGCNLWNGREDSRAQADCDFCDTDFVGTDGPLGGKYPDAADLVGELNALWPLDKPHKLCIVTGGEPLLQLDSALIDALHAAGFEIAVETNGTQPVPDGIDWLTVSPKGATELVVTAGDELKLIYPQDGIDPAAFELLTFTHFFLQPLDAPGRTETNIQAAQDYCLAHPKWRLGLQLHKQLGIK